MNGPSQSVAGQSEESPLFSVVWWGRDRLASAQETIAAMYAQTCTDFELVVEDCGSTDGTVEFFRAAASTDPRIRIFQHFRTRPGEALLSALRRCRGAYVAICPTDGHLLPNALATAALELDRHETAGGICSAGFLIDGHGGTFDHVDIISLLLTNYRPFLPAGFFRRSALLATGLLRDDWFAESLPLELSCRLAADRGLASCSEKLVECANPLRQEDGLPHDVQLAIDDRLSFLARIFSHDGFFARDEPALALESKVNQLAILWQQFRSLGRSEVEDLVRAPLLTAAWGLYAMLRMDHRVLRNLHRLLCIRSRDLGMLETPLQKILAATVGMRGRLPVHLGYLVWSTQLHGSWLIRKIVQIPLPAAHFHSSAPTQEVMYADLYNLAGTRYEARGQIDLALEMWRRAQPLHDTDIDALACQAMLKSPKATDASLAIGQADWVRRYVGDRPVVRLPRRAAPGGRVRIGYFCAFMATDTMRNMMRNVIASHDRSKFEVFGYAPRRIPPDIESAFDVWRHVPASRTDREFVDIVRADGLDVLVELTGFSPGNRFAAMALRCAPVQVSYLNHTGTSQVPNVDYVISDEVCTPESGGAQRYYSERIYRVPGCFFCFDYTTLNEPPVTESPHLKNGYITFGCFGSGGKIGNEQIALWAKLLHRLPNAVLCIQNSQLSAPVDRRFMNDRFRAFDIGPERLRLEGGVDRPTLLKVYGRIDISLDTWPYCGGNTIAESLWHGVPVITYRGARFSSAYGSSLVKAAGCFDLAAASPDEYVEKAVRLAADSARLVVLRQALRDMSVKYGLGDSKRHARALEHAYLDMLEQAGKVQTG